MCGMPFVMLIEHGGGGGGGDGGNASACVRSVRQRRLHSVYDIQIRAHIHLYGIVSRSRTLARTRSPRALIAISACNLCSTCSPRVLDAPHTHRSNRTQNAVTTSDTLCAAAAVTSKPVRAALCVIFITRALTHSHVHTLVRRRLVLTAETLRARPEMTLPAPVPVSPLIRVSIILCSILFCLCSIS